MRYHFTPVSRNAKTGPIPVVTASAETCPDSCALRGAGCYAEHGPLAIHWRRTEAWGLDLDALCQRIRRLPRRQLWRYGQAGDLPGMGDRIDAAALSQLAQANGGRPVLAYTHKPATPENLKALHRAAAAGFLVNLSADHPLHADDLAETGLPVVTVLPSAFARRKTETLSSFRVRLRHQPKHTPAGRRITICPATYTDTTCASCQACASRPWRRHHRLPRARHESSIDRPAHSEVRQAAAQTGHLRSRQAPPEVMVQRQPGNSSFIYWIPEDFVLNRMIPINIFQSDKHNCLEPDADGSNWPPSPLHRAPKRTTSGKPMARGASTFRQTDLTRALKAAIAAGLTPARAEIDADSRKIVVVFGEEEAEPVSDFDRWKAQRAG